MEINSPLDNSNTSGSLGLLLLIVGGIESIILADSIFQRARIEHFHEEITHWNTHDSSSPYCHR